MTGATIMIVEDEGIVAMDMKTRLQRYGYHVNAVLASGEDALRRAAEEKPDLVLMDIMLKGSIDGITAAAHLREDHAIPVIYVTSYADPETLAKAQVTEPSGYILKPFDERELRINIEMALHKRGLEKRGPARPSELAAFSQSLSRDLQARIRELEEYTSVMMTDDSSRLMADERMLLLSVLKQLKQTERLMEGFRRPAADPPGSVPTAL